MNAEFQRFLQGRGQSHADRGRMLEKVDGIRAAKQSHFPIADPIEAIGLDHTNVLVAFTQRVPRSLRVASAAVALMGTFAACAPETRGETQQSPPPLAAAANTLTLDHGLVFPFLKPARLTSGPHPTDIALKDQPGVIRDSLDFSSLVPPEDCDDQESLKSWPIAASASGMVITVGNEKDPTDPNHSIVKVKHELGPKQGIITSYMHLDNMKIKKGQRVDIDTILGFASCEAPPKGETKSPHLHFSVAAYEEKDDGTLVISPIPIRLVKLEGWEIQEGTNTYQGIMTKEGVVRTANKGTCTTDAMCGGKRNDLARNGDIFVQQPPTATPPPPTREPATPTKIPMPIPTATKIPPPTETPIPKTATPSEKIPTPEPGWKTQKSLMGYQINVPPGWSYFAGPFDQVIKDDLSLLMRIGHQKPTYGYDQDESIQNLIKNNPGIKAAKVKLSSGLTVWRISSRSTMGGMATGSERIIFMFQGEEWYALIEQRMFAPPALDQNKAVIDIMLDSFALTPR